MEAVWNTLTEIRAYLDDPHLITMIVRVCLAALAGILVGIEREFHGHAAGIRTHMLVSLGAALSALIGVMLSARAAELGLSSDVQRTGAQVMSGIGFLGAGTILVKKANTRITGLTTAAGLWATAAIGLAVGYGLYEAAYTTVLIVVLAFTLISRLEFRMTYKRQRIFIYLELDNVDSVKIMTDLMATDFGALEIQITPPRSGTAPHVGMEALIRLPHKVTIQEKIKKLHKLDHVVYALHIS